VVRRADGWLAVSRRHPGRGAWLCRDSPACVDRALRARAFERALRSRSETAAGPVRVDRDRLVTEAASPGGTGRGSEERAP